MRRLAPEAQDRTVRNVSFMRAPLLAAAATLLGVGCSSAHLFPVAGPISTKSTASLSASLSNIAAGHGKFKLVMPDGEAMEGTYSTSSDTNWSVGKGALTGTAADGSVAIAASDWAAVFDPPPSVANLQRGEANATGNKGTVLSVEFAVNGGSGKAFGVGKDNRGNLYRFEIEGLSSGTGVSQAAVPDAKPIKIAK
jgi:hypothetical protein